MVAAVLEDIESALRADLATLEATGRLRACPALVGSSRTNVTLEGRLLVSFCSNDYLGLACHPALQRAAALAAQRSGIGAGGSRLVAGDLPEHRDLEANLAEFLGLPAVLLFPTGYQANLGLVSALAGRDDLVVSDAANHASLIDGCRLSRATIAVYPHRDVAAARAALAQGAHFRRRLLITESVFSMDGDVAPLADLAETARLHRAALVVDEAHALGALGPAGQGLCKAAGVVPDVLIGTLGKAFGTAGGFVASSSLVRATLINRARTFLFTTAQPPPIAAASLAALELVRGPEGAARRARLDANIRLLRAHLDLPPGPGTPILPLLLGSDRAAVESSNSLQLRGFFVQAIRPPTVPEGTARLRVTVSADHQPQQIEQLADSLRHLVASFAGSP
jgi:8-amino-7-oxononanoate synthase